MKTTPIKQSNTWNYWKNFASIVCSRESTYRTGLDLTAFDLPTMGADLLRGPKKLAESTLECLMGTVSVVTAPIVTGLVGKFLSKFILPKEMQKDTLNILKFNMSEVRELDKFKKGLQRINVEETEDKRLISSLYKKGQNKDKSQKFLDDAIQIEKFCERFKASETNRKLALKLKKATIIGESFIEGGWWGSLGLILRWFRKNILHEERFTGTKGYVSDSESNQIGESGELTMLQKVLGVGSLFVSPIINIFMLNKLDDRKAVEKNRFLKIADEQLDMTHGVYPKIGLLFSYTTLPKWISAISLSQGSFERTERIMKLFTVVSSWWLGHRVTNGLLAKSEDKRLSKEYKVKQGILLEPKDVNEKHSKTWFDKLTKTFPEPARIHHVLKSTADNKALQNEAEDAHAKCLYKGFALHSGLVLVINLIVNQITKFRALHALGR